MTAEVLQLLVTATLGAGGGGLLTRLWFRREERRERLASALDTEASAMARVSHAALEQTALSLQRIRYLEERLDRLRESYEGQLAELRKLYEQERQNRMRLEGQVRRLRSDFSRNGH